MYQSCFTAVYRWRACLIALSTLLVAAYAAVPALAYAASPGQVADAARRPDRPSDFVQPVWYSSADTMANLPTISEQALNDAACGVAAATMVIDARAQQLGRRQPSIYQIARYVQEWRRGGPNGPPGGTTFTQLRTGLERASRAWGAPVGASWVVASPQWWYGNLSSDLAAGDMIIAFIPNGGALWNNSWHYGHYVVVTGFSGQDVIYHDPWDGNAHRMTRSWFARVWGTRSGRGSGWQYLRVVPWS
jgi:hypothetical protein